MTKRILFKKYDTKLQETGGDNTDSAKSNELRKYLTGALAVSNLIH